MVAPIKLHPRIKERRSPRISASALAEYVIATPDKHDDIIHDARFVRPPATSPWSDALRALRSYCSDPLRETGHIDSAINALLLKSRSEQFTPSVRDEAARCAEALETFIQNENAFGTRATPLIECPRLEPFDLGGAMVSCQPDFVVGSRFPPDEEKIGCAMLRLQKHPNPDGCKTEKTRDDRAHYRREMARYMLVIARAALINNGVPSEQIDHKRMFLYDIRLKERLEMPTDRVSREKRILGACKQIVRLWDTTEARPGDYVKEGS